MAKIVRLTESDLTRLVRKVIKEQTIASNILSGSSQKAVKQVFDSCRNTQSPSPSHNTNKIVDGIYRAVQGVGTDESAIFRALAATKDFNTFCNAVGNYKTTYGTDLFSDLDGDIDQETVWSQISRILRSLKRTTGARPTAPQKPMGGTKPGVKPTMIQKPMGGTKPTNTQGTAKDPKIIRQQQLTTQRTSPTPTQVRR